MYLLTNRKYLYIIGVVIFQSRPPNVGSYYAIEMTNDTLRKNLLTARIDRLEENMGDFIKDLNIIDYLGIAVPGCILVLLISGDSSALYLWTDYFGSNTPALVKGVFLLISGYLAGMLLHEIGDLLEKGAWCIQALDPKSYAANAVGAKKICEAAEKAGLIQNQSALSFSDAASRKLKGYAGAVSAAVVLFLATAGFCFAMDSSCIKSNARSIGICSYYGTIVLFVLLIVIIFYLGCQLRKRTLDNQDTTTCEPSFGNEVSENGQLLGEAPCGVAPDKKNNVRTLQSANSIESYIENVRMLNPQIQTYITQHGVHSKLPMFDSFRHVMRNLVICASVINTYSVWRPIDLYQDIAAAMSFNGATEWHFGGVCMWFSLFVCIAFVRYSHYAFLRYKYGFENFIMHVHMASNVNHDEFKLKIEELEISRSVKQ